MTATVALSSPITTTTTIAADNATDASVSEPGQGRNDSPPLPEENSHPSRNANSNTDVVTNQPSRQDHATFPPNIDSRTTSAETPRNNLTGYQRFRNSDVSDVSFEYLNGKQ